VFEYSDIFKVFVVPVYIMVVSNLINMHSGFNGLQCGLLDWKLPLCRQVPQKHESAIDIQTQSYLNFVFETLCLNGGAVKVWRPILSVVKAIPNGIVLGVLGTLQGFII
jgi:hypothetical protein